MEFLDRVQEGLDRIGLNPSRGRRHYQREKI
jgi:hypothetical protein